MLHSFSKKKPNDFKGTFRRVIKALQQITISCFHTEENKYCSNFDQIHITLGLAGVQISSWQLNVLVKISHDNVLNVCEVGTYS